MEKEMTFEQGMEHVFSQVKQYAVEHGLTPEQVRNYFDVGITAAHILTGERSVAPSCVDVIESS